MANLETLRRHPARHLDRLRERRYTEHPCSHPEPYAGTLAGTRGHLHAVGVAHPSGLSLPVDEHAPGFARRHRQHDRTFDPHRTSVGTPVGIPFEIMTGTRA
jgi:hypothetical protein